MVLKTTGVETVPYLKTVLRARRITRSFKKSTQASSRKNALRSGTLVTGSLFLPCMLQKV